MFSCPSPLYGYLSVVKLPRTAATGGGFMLKRTAVPIGVLGALTGMLVGLAGAADAGTSAPKAAATHIVAVRTGVDPARLAGRYGIAVEDVWDAALNGFSAALSSKQVKALSKDADVDSVSANTEFRFADVNAPQIVGTGVERIGGLASPTAQIDGSDERVDADIAMIDSGIASHPDLNLVGGYDCGKSGSYADTEGHGTWTAGIAAGIDNEIGVVGSAPGARLWALRVSDGKHIKSSYLICALEWVTEHASTIEVANMSVGGPGSDNGNCGIISRSNGKKDKVKDPLHTAICTVVEAGVTVTVSAGNSSQDAGEEVPAAYDEVVTVSAFTDFDGLPGGAGTPECLEGAGFEEEDDTFAFFSNFGPDVDIAAPGVCIEGPTFDGYAIGDGTSASAPFVAGAAALYIANNPGASPAQVKAALIANRDAAPMAGDPDGIAEGLLNVAGF
jgi:hypothetical protein